MVAPNTSEVIQEEKIIHLETETDINEMLNLSDEEFDNKIKDLIFDDEEDDYVSLFYRDLGGEG